MVGLVEGLLGLLAVAGGAAVLGWLALLAGLRGVRPKRPLRALTRGVFAAAVLAVMVLPDPFTVGGVGRAAGLGLLAGAFGDDLEPALRELVLRVSDKVRNGF